LGQPVHGVRQLAPGHRRARPVLSQPDGRLLLGELLRRPAVDATPGEVELPAYEPARPFGPAGGVDDLRPRFGELQAEVLDHRWPKALGLLDRDAVEVVVALDAEPARQPSQVRALDLLGRGRPHELGHGGSVRLTALRRHTEVLYPLGVRARLFAPEN